MFYVTQILFQRHRAKRPLAERKKKASGVLNDDDVDV